MTAKKTGHGSYPIATAPRLFVGAVLYVCYAGERRFCRGRYKSITYVENASQPGTHFFAILTVRQIGVSKIKIAATWCL